MVEKRTHPPGGRVLCTTLVLAYGPLLHSSLALRVDGAPAYGVGCKSEGLLKTHEFYKNHTRISHEKGRSREIFPRSNRPSHTCLCLFYLSLEARVSTSLVIAGTCRCNGDEFHLQRAKKNWAIHGDRNTPFFHLSITKRTRKNRISYLHNPHGSHSTTPEQLADTLIAYFQNIFSNRSPHGHPQQITTSTAATYTTNLTHAGPHETGPETISTPTPSRMSRNFIQSSDTCAAMPLPGRMD